MISRLLIAFTSLLLFGTIYAQSIGVKKDSTKTFSGKPYPSNSNSTKIKWTRQLPSLVRTALYRSQYSSWYVEKIIRYDVDGKKIYRVYVNNGNLLDGDHHDSFLKSDSLDITGNGTIVNN